MLIKCSCLPKSISDHCYAFFVSVSLAGALDVAILVDSSDDISAPNWANIIQFIKTFIGRFPNVDSTPQGTRFGLISYATSPAIHFNFKRLSGANINTKQFVALVDTTPRQNGNKRRIDRALELAETGLFTPSGGARDGAKKVSPQVLICYDILQTSRCFFSSFFKFEYLIL